MDQLDSEEKDILTSYERGGWKPIVDLESEMERYRKYARATLNEGQSTDNRNRPEQRRLS